MPGRHDVDVVCASQAPCSIYVNWYARNKFCFTGGQIVASVELPGTNNVVGMWPALWTMGNLGRAGYGASLEGMVIN